MVVGRRTAAVEAALRAAARVVVVAPKLLKALREDPRVEHVKADPAASRAEAVELVKSVRASLRGRAPAAVLAGTEAAVVPAARLREALGVPGIAIDVAYACTDKVRMKRRVAEAGIPYTPFLPGGNGTDRSRVVREIGLPVVLKPRVGSGGRGTSIVRTPEEIPDPVPRRQMVEALIAGRELSVESLVLDGRVRWSNLTEYVEIRGVNHLPYRPERRLREAILELNRRAVEALGVERGICHLEAFVTADGLCFGELAVRPPGGYIMELISLAYGFDAWDAWIRVESGREPEVRSRPRRHAAARVIHPGAGRVVEAAGAEQARLLPGVHEASVRVRPGDIVPARLGAGQEVAHLIVAGRDRDETLARLLAASAAVRIRVAPADV